VAVISGLNMEYAYTSFTRARSTCRNVPVCLNPDEDSSIGRFVDGVYDRSAGGDVGGDVAGAKYLGLLL
jgi:hypothetical protein